MCRDGPILGLGPGTITKGIVYSVVPEVERLCVPPTLSAAFNMADNSESMMTPSLLELFSRRKPDPKAKCE